MTDYISRAELDAAFCKASAPAFDNHDKATFIVDYVKVLETIPAADVRPVVLCKDCYYADYSGMGNGTVWCMEMERAMQETDFCSRGKREES